MHNITPTQQFLLTILMSPITYIILFALIVGMVALAAMYGWKLFKRSKADAPANMVPLKKYNADIAELQAHIERYKTFGDVMAELAGTNQTKIEELQALQPSPFKLAGEPFTRDDAAILGDGLETDGWSITDPERAPEAVDALFERMTTFLEVHQRQVVGVPMNQQTRWIMGQPNFRCAGYASQLRAIGHEINRKSEDEQAHVMHWMLNLYFEHGDKWRNKAQELLAVKHAPAANDATDKVAANG